MERAIGTFELISVARVQQQWTQCLKPLTSNFFMPHRYVLESI